MRHQAVLRSIQNTKQYSWYWPKTCIWYKMSAPTLSTGIGAQANHQERTASNTRNEIMSRATVQRIVNLSPTVKNLIMKVQEPKFTFKAGQWVDFHIAGVETVGGYSMCSSPQQLKQDQTLELAVKYSSHPPALWVHTQCKEGDEVNMRVGGDFYYNPTPSPAPQDLLLIAGGVGINPLYSILRHTADLHRQDKNTANKLILLYSAETEQELLFQNDINCICQEIPEFKCHMFTTKQKSTKSNLKAGRIDRDAVRSCFQPQQLNKEKTMCYICGPDTMIDNMQQILIENKLKQKQIIYEKWW